VALPMSCALAFVQYQTCGILATARVISAGFVYELHLPSCTQEAGAIIM
jgi:hypothetical protein